MNRNSNPAQEVIAHPHARRHRKPEAAMKNACFAIVMALLISGSAVFAQTRSLSWPSGWRSPLSSTVQVTANYGAYSLGCTNANTTSPWTFYLPTGRKQHLGLDMDADVADKVRAIADGRILRVDAQWGAHWRDVVVVEHFDRTGLRFSVAYGHIVAGNSPLTSTAWRAGDVVKKGNVLGTVAGIIVDGVVTSHLHVGIMEGESALIPGSFNHAGTAWVDPCPSTLRDTRSPEVFLRNRTASSLSGSIVGWRNADGSITSWLVKSTGGKLRRYWIPNTTVYACLARKGVDRGPMPARFLDQLPDQWGVHATCR